ncbi:hypothetical protein C482_10032 [Natrialba chahannaoensis JCM 10990]|uniref:Phasin family protein n=1 Tax=Natrialba chahannaoensis JCM 10990 TaxID=1227492 RepID=M0ANA6_9EURY|nr:hypothetical protein [Natrialba chahannaoensis]ELY99816.1 hypothetical protein C482_10032 [Natrialba chahannaoensis JCM 10990]
MTQNPFSTVFDAQRTAIKHSQNMAHDAIEAQQASIGAFANAVENSNALVESNAELTKGVIHAYFNALEASVPEDTVEFDDLSELVDEGVDSATDAQLQSLEVAVEALRESETAYDEFTASYSEAVDNSFEAFIEVHEQVAQNMTVAAESVEEATEEFDASP